MSTTYIGIIRDHSMSMQGLVRAARDDYNSNIQSIKDAAKIRGVKTYVSTVVCGGGVHPELKRVPIHEVQELSSYSASGRDTPLFGSVMEIINQFTAISYEDPDAIFVILATTDGENNAGAVTAQILGNAMKEKEKSDRWTFTFRVPFGYKRSLTRLGIPEGNIIEWEQTTHGVEQASIATRGAYSTFYADVATKGVTSTKTFFADLKVPEAVVESKLTEISSEVTIWPVSSGEDGMQIRDFVEKRLDKKMLKGSAFYQHTKSEDKVQAYKEIAVRIKSSGQIYGGQAARSLLKLPNADVRLRPGDHPNYEIFVQSTSVNRKILSKTSVLYWPKIGVPFKEGKSS